MAAVLITAKAVGAPRTLVLRAESAFFQSDEVAAALRSDACFSITARLNAQAPKAIVAICADAWTTSGTPTQPGTKAASVDQPD